jgi:hypothetical protein
MSLLGELLSLPSELHVMLSFLDNLIANFTAMRTTSNLGISFQL